MQEQGFTDDGRHYTVRDTHLIDSADADLWNDTMYLQIDHRGRVRNAGFQQPDMTAYSDDLRCFYLRDDSSGRFWSVPFDPVQAEPDSFEFSIGSGDLHWTVLNNGIKVNLRVFIPRDDNLEIWTARATNTTRRTRKLSLYSFLPAGRLGLLSQESWYDRKLGGAIHSYFPYYVHYPDYYKLDKLRNQVFCASDRKPSSYELSLKDFVGPYDLCTPDQLSRPRLGNPRRYETANEKGISAFQYARTLAPGATFEVNLAFGPAKDTKEAMRLKRKYLERGAPLRALERVYRFLDRHSPTVRIGTPDSEFNHYINHWQSRRSLILARTIRHNLAPQGRNVIQDAMGGVFTDPASSRLWFTRIWSHQHTNGWLPHGMPFVEGVAQIPINSIPHKDINSWGPTSLMYYVCETGDFSILDEKIPFAGDSKKRATLYQHVCLGLDWLLRDRTKRGLCRIGQGDWNDPLNMAGLKEKGESIWLSEALSFALDAWSRMATHRADTRRAKRYAREARKLRRAINRYGWDGAWYGRGFTDAAKPFGVRKSKEGKIFLNAQSWAIMCGAADAKKTASCVKSVEHMLMTPSGPMTLSPPYSGMDETIGKLTQKIPGWNENASVYCHAATFYAYALYCAREKEKAFQTLRCLLPGGMGNTVGRAGQIPLYIPNFYRGAATERKAGRSSHAPNTGTASWYYRTAISMLMGVRAELDGLRIDPQLPRKWGKAQVTRKWRGATFEIEITNTGRRSKPDVRLDGEKLGDNLIPVQRKGSTHTILARI